MHRVPVQIVGSPYQVCVGAGALDQLPEMLTQTCPAARYAIIADSTVAGLYGDRVRTLANTIAPADVFPFPAGEWNKTREQWQALTDAMLASGVGRDGAVIALGGGVTGDLAGFVAATYLRGVPYVHLPTTVLAMVDSSVGGKTGVDTTHGKNLVGAFHQPRIVVADIGLLATLPDIQLRAGLAEAVKHGAIADRDHFAQIEERRAALLGRDLEELTAIVGRSVEIKADIVARDEKERGQRAILNFGHTVGHALETLTGYTLLHGEAVALGMAVEARLGEASGVTEYGTATAIERALVALELPTEVGEVTPEQLIHVMEMDKKSRAGTVKFAFLKRLGQAARSEDGSWTFGAPAELIAQAIVGPSGSHSA
jgi:3-dehydroquinate synthase